MHRAQSCAAGASPLPAARPKHERRLSIKSITASIRRSTLSSPTTASQDTTTSLANWSWPSASEPNSAAKPKRPSSLFSWRGPRSSVVVVDVSDKHDTREDDEEARGLKTFKFPPASASSSLEPARKPRRARHSEPLPPVPPLVIEIDSIPTLSNASYTPLATPARRRSSSAAAPSLPEFRHSTFQPLSIDTVSPREPLPESATGIGKHLAARGPFPTRPLSHLSSDGEPRQPAHQLPRSDKGRTTSTGTAMRGEQRDPRTGLTKSSSTPIRLEPRSPRVRTHRRSRSTPNALPSRTPPPPPPVPTSAPAARPHHSPSSSMHRSPSFTLSLPTVAEIPPPPSPPTPTPARRKLKPIVIAPRTPPSLSSSTPNSSCSSFASDRAQFSPDSPSLGSCFSSSSSSSDSTTTTMTTADNSPRTYANVKLHDDDGAVENKSEKDGDGRQERFDWQDLERRLRTLSDDRLQILLAELKR